MKTTKFIFLMALTVGLLLSCSRTDNDEGFSGVNLKARMITENIIIVEPNGVDDTDNLANAFEQAKSYGPGSVVQLVEGDYYLGYIEIREFNGKFRGAGKGNTVITALNNLDNESLLNQNLNCHLIKFVGGEVFMSDMTIRTPDGILTTYPEMTWIEGLVLFSARSVVYTSDNDYIKAVVDNVEFISGSDWPSGWRSNCNMGIMVGYDNYYYQLPEGWPLSPSDITVTNCYFENFDIYGVLIAYLNGGNVIAGDGNNGNVFVHNSTSAYGYGGSLSFWHNNDLNASIKGNSFYDGPGARFGIEATSAPWPAYLQQVEQTKATLFDIERNEFVIEGGTGGVLVNDQRRVIYSDAIPMLVKVKSNRFILSENAYTGMGFFNMSGMIISNNILSGQGSYGVRIMRTAPVYNENGLMIGNNFSNSSYSVTPVLLNAGSRNWTIAGGNLGESVIDNGENNIITGYSINYSEAPFGETIVDNLTEMREVIKSLR
jgi:hypothetical protein